MLSESIQSSSSSQALLYNDSSHITVVKRGMITITKNTILKQVQLNFGDDKMCPGCVFLKPRILTPADIVERSTVVAPTMKERYKLFFDTYGCTAKTVSRICNAMLLSLWKDPLGPWWNRMGVGYGGSLKGGVVAHMNHYIDVIRQAEEDGIQNIVPIVVSLAMSPKEAKQHLGKGLWKRLCKNSMTRNILIVKRLGRALMRHRISADYYSREKLIGELSKLSCVPSSILKTQRRLNHSAIEIIKDKRSPLKIKDYIKSEALPNIIEDTIRMADQLGTKTQISWTSEEWKEAHDKFTLKIQEIKDKRFKDVFSVVESAPFTGVSMVIDGVKCTGVMLKTGLEVKQEGLDMHHCVGSYVESCIKGRYCVWHLACGDEESTLSFVVEDVNIAMGSHNHSMMLFTPDQHYSHCNRDVGDISAKFRDQLAYLLNHKYQSLKMGVLDE